jgi:hypothetical protein
LPRGVWCRLAFSLRPLLLVLLQSFLLRCVTLRQCLRLRLVLLLKHLHTGACRWLLRGPFVIGCLLLLQFLPLFFLAITQLVLLLLIHLVALDICSHNRF